ECTHDGVTVANLGTRSVHDIAAALHHADQLVVEHVLSLGVQRRIDRHHVANLDQRLDIRMKGQSKLLLDRLGEAVLIGVVQLDVEGLQPTEYGKTDAAGSDSADIHAFKVIGAFDAVGDVPAAFDHPAIGRDVVPHESQDHHHHVLGDADRIAIGHLGDGNALIHSRLKVGVVGADARGDDEL